jgi:hypothetical protein
VKEETIPQTSHVPRPTSSGRGQGEGGFISDIIISYICFGLLFPNEQFMKSLFIVCLLFLQSFCFSQSWQWSRQIGGSGFDNAQISYIDSSGNIFIWGNYATNPGGPPSWTGSNLTIENQTLIGIRSSFIAKYTVNGNLLWVRNLAPMNGSCVVNMEFNSLNNDFILTGYYSDSINLPGTPLGNPGVNQFLAKMNLDGYCSWAKTIGSYFSIAAVTPDDNGNLYLSGFAAKNTMIDSCTLSHGLFIAKFNSSGNSIWTKNLCSTDNPYFDLKHLSYYNNGIYAMGYTQGFGTLKIDTISIEIQYLQNVIGILCLDSLANAKWFKVDGYPSSVVGNRSCDMNRRGEIFMFSIVEDTVVFGNDTLTGQGLSRVIAEYNSDGQLISTNHLLYNSNYSGYTSRGVYAQEDSIFYIIDSFSGTAVIGEYYLTAEKDPDILLAKFNDAGECLGAEHLGGGQGTSVYPGPDGVYITGVFSPLPSDTGTITVGNQTYHTYGYEDIIFAKHDRMTGTKETRRNDNSLVIYANPSKGSFRVKIPDAIVNSSSLLLTIYNNQGKIIHSTRFAPQGETPQFDLSGQPAGVYPVTISNGKKTYTGKLVVE